MCKLKTFSFSRFFLSSQCHTFTQMRISVCLFSIFNISLIRKRLLCLSVFRCGTISSSGSVSSGNYIVVKLPILLKINIWWPSCLIKWRELSDHTMLYLTSWWLKWLAVIMETDKADKICQLARWAVTINGYLLPKATMHSGTSHGHIPWADLMSFSRSLLSCWGF